MKVSIDADKQTVLFVCSPSLGILDNWISVLMPLRYKLPDAKFIFVVPKSRSIAEIKLDTVLFKMASDIFDLVVFKSDAGVWLHAHTFADAKEVNSSSNIKFFHYGVRVLEKLGLKKLKELFLIPYKAIVSFLYSELLFNLSAIEKTDYVTLFDIYELDKPYNKDLYTTIVNSHNFSILHGINVNGIDKGKMNKQGKKSLEIENSIVYAFSQKEIEFYQVVYGIPWNQLKVYGIPRHQKEWMSELVKKEKSDSTDFGKYIFVISRPVGDIIPYERKKQFLEMIKKVSEEYNLKVVIKLHPKEKKDSLFENVLGEDTYLKNWKFSKTHPVVLGKECEFAVCFYSGVPVDLIGLGTPTIELLDLKGLEKYDNENSLRDSLGQPVSEPRYLNFVLGASTYNEFYSQVQRVIAQKDVILEELKQAYKENFPIIENVNELICQDILESFENKKNIIKIER